MKVIALYLLLINLFGLLIMGADKRKAKRKNRRVPEKRLFFIALAGGAAGVWIGMQLWRHKTKHESFTVGVPFLFILNVLCVYLLLKWLYFPEI
ncbi:DUF1294 domain-containing protein [Paenibacillus sp. GD4]|jgi:uncharacterized membrane protein YsdA (DUF1294 family)|uniref:DUF1294 domain-containing protein n=1 Tax=Paenibacillus TaxID=44249 RepID=UPI002542A942|nr:MULTISPECIES: DUF1294 domain-containing protein [Paenibacillus]MDQ1909265.1 DUF1294 domain-containing protein [Paenibacillus sp. GD4]